MKAIEGAHVVEEDPRGERPAALVRPRGVDLDPRLDCNTKLN